MSLAPGTRLGPYEIASAIGAGGMGEVYRARDSRLDREVAIKILPEHLSSSDELRQRFEREAKTLSQLSHPHICGIYDVGLDGDTDYLVMELLEGDLLSDRLERGPLPLDQVLSLGREIADALDQAHRSGIVHRDLKPGNVMITRSGVKLLDFGLAKAVSSPLSSGTLGGGETSLPTQAPPAGDHLTQEGTILGTVQYMAPEQLEGKPADARTDLFAFGALLYEMATGHKAFSAPSHASLITAIMSSRPPSIAQAQPAAPPLLDRLIHACLEKDPDDRIQTAHDAMLHLRWIDESSAASLPQPVTPRRKHRERLAWAIAAVALGLAAWLGLTRGSDEPADDARLLYSSVLLPEQVGLNNAAISPDGSRLVFSGVDADGSVQLWQRSLDSEEVRPMSGTEGAVLPFWSPDGRFIGFFADKQLKRIEAQGGAAFVLREVDGLGGAWGPDGDILFTAPSGPILRLSPDGGEPQPVTEVDREAGETSHRYPVFLPDGRHFLYLALNTAGNSRDPANQIWLASLDDGPLRPLLAANFNPLFADGYLLFIRGGDAGGSLLAQPFDADRLEIGGEPVTVAEHVGLYGDFLGLGSVSASTTGTLVYDASRLLTRLEWFDRAGKQGGVFGEPAPRQSVALAPDGRQVAFDLYDSSTQTTQVWVGDLERGVQTRLTSAPSSNAGPVWSPDGLQIAFQSDRAHQADVIVKSTGGAREEQALTDEDGQKIPMDWSSDGRWILAFDREPAGERLVGITAFPVDGGDPVPVLPRIHDNIGTTQMSPDGRWLAYDSNESGRREVYVISFPEGQRRVQISNAGGINASWTRDGRELLYQSFDGFVMSVAIDTDDGLRVASPAPLFRLPEGANRWDVSSDGERFLVNVPLIKSSSVPLTLVQNWSQVLER